MNSTAAPQKVSTKFLSDVINAGYDGIEIDIPADKKFEQGILSGIEKLRADSQFIFIAQQWLPPANESFEGYRKRFSDRLEQLISFRPDFINSHTGKDFFSFEQNCELIDLAMNLTAKSGIRILHETHRGRFSFHLSTILKYLEKFPQLELVADFSHWCAVSESLLEDQEETLKLVIPHCSHIHARIGYEHSPQVNDFRAPEWNSHVERFISWWEPILNYHKSKNHFTISPEFGPVSYMPTEPYSQKPLADQWEENVAMMEMLRKRFGLIVT
jgi:sugar phosphate isomerase/epimerase